MDPVDNIVTKVKKALMSRDFEFAERILRSAKTVKPDVEQDPRYLRALGMLYLKAENLQRALAVFKTLNSIEPDNPETLNTLGVIFRRKKEYTHSLNALLQAKNLGDKSAGLYYNLGNTYKEMQAFEDAERCFLQALEINPRDALAYNHIGTIEFLSGSYENALRAYRNGLKIDPNHPFIHFNLARLFRLRRKPEDAEREYLAALKNHPGWQQALEELSSLYSSMGETEKRAGILQRILSIDSTNVPALMDSAEIAEKTDKPEKAKGLYRRAVELAGNDSRPARKFSRFLQSCGEGTEAAEVLEQFNAGNPEETEVLLDLADLYLESSRYAPAREILAKYREKNPDDVRLLRLTAKLHTALGEESKAKDCLQRILELEPGRIEVRKEFAQQLAEAGLLQEARKQMEMYLQESPADSGARMLLGTVYEQLRDFEKALSCYTSVIEREKDNIKANAALSLLYQRMGKNTEAVALAGRMVTKQGTDTGDNSLETLQESLTLYEQAMNHYRISNPTAAAENLRLLSRILGGRKRAARPAPGGTEDAAEIPLLETGLPGTEEQPENSLLPAAAAPEPEEGLHFPPEPDGFDGSLREFIAGLQAAAAEEECLENIRKDYPQNPAQEEPEQTEPDIPEPAAEEKPAPVSRPVQQPVQQPLQQPVQMPVQIPQFFPAAPVNPEMPRMAEIRVQPAPQPVQPAAAVNPEPPEPPEPGDKDGNGQQGTSGRQILELLEYLRETLDFLPENLRQDYRTSDERLILEYTISKLQGRPGIRKNSVAQSAYQKAQIRNHPAENPGKPDGEPIEEVFSFLADLAMQLPDQNFGAALNRHAANVKHKLQEKNRRPDA